MSIFVGNLPFRAEQDDVAELFAPFGDVVSCSLPLERDTGRKRGFAFVEMVDDAAEIKAIDALQGAELMGRPLRINKAEPRGAGGGGYGNGGGGSGARGWEDRSYGSGAPAPSDNFDAGRTRRRRSGGGDTGGGDTGGGSYYGGAEG